MAAAPCSRCGGLLPLGATFCPFCGATVGAPSPSSALPSASGSGGRAAPAVGPPLAPSAQGTGSPPAGYSAWAQPTIGFTGPPAPTEATRAQDLDALASLGWAMGMIVVAGAVGLLVFLLPNSQFANVDNNSLSSAYHFGTDFYVIVAVSGAFNFLDIYFLRTAFHRLAPVDRRFSTPSKLTLVLLVGAVLAVLGLVVVLHTLATLGNCSVSTTGVTTGNCQGLATLALGELLLLPGAILSVIGYIGCLVGLWRAGARYQESSFKIGTVLLLIPLVSVAGAILLLLAARSTRAKLGGAGPGMTSFP